MAKSNPSGMKVSAVMAVFGYMNLMAGLRQRDVCYVPTTLHGFKWNALTPPPKGKTDE